MLSTSLRRKNQLPPHLIARPVFEGLEDRVLLSTVQVVAAPVTNIPPVGVQQTTARGDDGSESESESGTSGEYLTGTSPAPSNTPQSSDDHVKPVSEAAPETGIGIVVIHVEGHAPQSQPPGVSDEIITVLTNPKTGEYSDQPGASISVTVQPAYVTFSGSGSVTPAVQRPQDHTAVAAVAMPRQTTGVSVTSGTASKSNVPADSTSIAPSAPQHASPVLGQPFAVGPISAPLTSSTPHAHYESSLVMESWKTAVASFSQTPVVAGLEWEVAAATNTFSAGASAEFVENLVASNAAALAHVANTIALRLYEEDAMLWKETAAFIGVAMMIGSYIAKTRPTTQSPPRKTEEHRKYLCVGE
jgi:hypothetical protein